LRGLGILPPPAAPLLPACGRPIGWGREEGNTDNGGQPPLTTPLPFLRCYAARMQFVATCVQRCEKALDAHVIGRTNRSSSSAITCMSTAQHRDSICAVAQRCRSTGGLTSWRKTRSGRGSTPARNSPCLTTGAEVVPPRTSAPVLDNQSYGLA